MNAFIAKKPCPGREGFTLLEVMMALAIFMLVVSVIFQVNSSTVSISESADHRMVIGNQISKLLESSIKEQPWPELGEKDWANLPEDEHSSLNLHHYRWRMVVTEYQPPVYPIEEGEQSSFESDEEEPVPAMRMVEVQINWDPGLDEFMEEDDKPYLSVTHILTEPQEEEEDDAAGGTSGS